MTTHCHFEGGEFLRVDDSFVNRVRLRQVDHFAEREQGVVSLGGGGAMSESLKRSPDLISEVSNPHSSDMPL